MVREALISLSDEKSRHYHSLTRSSDRTILGVRIPKIRKLASEIRSEETLDEILSTEDLCYEEVLLAMCIFTKLEMTKEERKERLRIFLNLNDSWATNDFLTSCCTFMKKDGEFWFDCMDGLLCSANPYDVRFSITSMMSYFLDDEHADESLRRVSCVHSDHRYVVMAQGWFFATALAKQRERTLPYYTDSILSDSVLSISIRKAIESFRVSDEDKKRLKLIRLQSEK